MSKNQIKLGSKFGKLTVVDYRERNEHRQSWLCQCECGKIITLGRFSLLGTPNRRPVKSCGCSQNAYDGKVSKNLRVYNIWHHMNARCYKPNAITYKKYGAKGIRVCDEWREGFNDFLEWALANGYTDELSLDRIDPSGDYSPSNCRWVDKYVQSQNRRAQYNSKTGVSGVTIAKDGSYRVSIKRKGVLLNLGTQKELDKAIGLRRAAEAYFNEHQTFEGFDKSKVS